MIKGVTSLSNDEIRAEIGELDRDVAKHNTEAAEYEALARTKRSEAARIQTRINSLRDELDRRNRPAPEPRISEHALLRYIERAHGIDLDMLRAHIMTPYVISAIKAGAARVTVDGVKFVIKENVIVTALDEQRTNVRSIRTGKDEPSEAAIIADGVAEYEEERRISNA